MSAHKGQGSVQSGIDCVRTYKIYTCIENVNYNREKSLYRWREKDGKAMDEPLKEDDHAMDAERYAIWTALGERNPVARLW
jgi:phage terminase large subunit